MSEKTLKWIIYSAGVVCLYLMLAIRIMPLFNAILKEKVIPDYWENTKWGELYYFNFIKDFQEKNLPASDVKYRFTDKHPSLQDADILTFGDSFFDFTRMTTFPEQLSDSLGKKVFYARNPRPLEFLDHQNYTNTTPKYLIYETAERFFHERFITEQKEYYEPEKRSSIGKAFHRVRKFIFMYKPELLLDQILCRSYVTYDIHSAINTLKFKWFGQITDQTPVYSTRHNIPWLFIESEVSDDERGYFYQHSAEEIDNYCDHIESLSKKLKERYNLEMIFMIIPNKFTIYYEIANTEGSEYGNLIPALYSELENRGIPVIQLYDEYLAQRENKLLYYGTDTHWTEEGLHIALNKTMEQLDTLEYYNYHAHLLNKNSQNP